MESKLMSLKFMFFGILCVFLAGAVSAVSIPIDGGVKIAEIPTAINHDAGSFVIKFNITNAGVAGDATLTLTLTSGVGTTTIPATISLADGSTTPATVPVTGTVSFNAHQSGVIAGEFKVKYGTSTERKVSFSVPINNAPALVLSADKSRITSDENINLKVENTGNVPLNIAMASSGAFDIAITPSSFTLNAGESKEDITGTPGDLSELEFGDHTATITATDSAKGVQSNATITFSKSFCRVGEAGGNLSITRIRIDTDGLDEKEWRPLDTITIEVDVKNEGDERVDDVVVELGLFDTEGKDQSGDLDFENEGEEKIDLGNIGDGDKEKATFEFKISPDLEKADYKLAIKAYSEDSGESAECTSESGDLNNDFYQDIEVLREDDEGRFIVFDGLEINPAGDVSCGDKITVTVDMYNIGDEDQDQVRITLANPQLKIKEEKIIKDLSEGDSTRITFNFEVPNDAEDKTYVFEIGAEYDYRSGTYRESSDEPIDFSLKVIGCSEIPAEESRIALIAASSDADAKSGEEFIVKAGITSLLPNEADFVVNVVGFSSWADLTSISDRLIHLKSGESKEITIAFKIRDDATGLQSFTLNAISGGKTETQDIDVNIGESSGGGIEGLSLGGGNSLIWIIGIINVILIILIIIVAVRISRR